METGGGNLNFFHKQKTFGTSKIQKSTERYDMNACPCACATDMHLITNASINILLHVFQYQARLMYDLHHIVFLPASI